MIHVESLAKQPLMLRNLFAVCFVFVFVFNLPNFEMQRTDSGFQRVHLACVYTFILSPIPLKRQTSKNLPRGDRKPRRVDEELWTLLGGVRLMCPALRGAGGGASCSAAGCPHPGGSAG